MNLKQKVSLLSAGMLPALALGAYFLITPARANAADCPSGHEQHSPCGPGGQYCETGTGGCVYPGNIGYFVFCGQGEQSQGTCEGAGIVCCTYPGP